MTVSPESALEPGQAEVGDPQLTAVVDQQVRRLDVAVDHAQMMCVLEGLGGLDAQPGDLAEERAGPPVVAQRQAARRDRPGSSTCRPGEERFRPIPGQPQRPGLFARNSRSPAMIAASDWPEISCIA